jgi:cytochrome c biogenesis protein ResB
VSARSGPGRDQVVLDLILLPDAQLGADGRPTAIGEGDEPVLLVAAHRGPEVLLEDGERREVDRRQPELGTTAALTVGAPAMVGDGRWEVTFTEPARWVGFQVSRVPGSRAAFAASLLLLVALTASLLAYPTRLWVEARPVEGGTELTVAGVARHRPEAFDAAFPRHVDALRRRVQSADSRVGGTPAS